MKIIYHCYGGTHSSVTAACIHLGLLPRDRAPGYDELLNLDLFDRRNVCDIGKITFVGRDGLGNEIYVVGRRSRPKLLYNVIEGMSRLFDTGRDSLMLVDVSSFVNSSMRAGGFLSRRIGLVGIGRPIVAWGTLRNYRRLAEAVEEVLSILRRGPETKDKRIIQAGRPEVAC
ncbi:MAG: DUF3189 family protein [Peptococcaceae bacterium]|nr:DUF3189 family protein [Peptococcaceae bacterium]